MEPRLACGHDPLAIAAVADGAASASERATVEAVLLSCRACRDYWHELRWLAEALRTPSPPPPTNLTQRVMAAVEREERKRTPLRVGMALVAVLLIVMGIAMTIAPADGLTESVAATEPLWTDMAATMGDPLTLAVEVDRIAIAGLSMAVGASVFLLTRLIRTTEA
ncbi:MAG: hypothetical protein KatS3mg060_3107 [Dehalococcoidia bacterium]|nr:MAG: hypothetical protein KatS3mg060_3107 [Dehalococcoidia bacterium]